MNASDPDAESRGAAIRLFAAQRGTSLERAQTSDDATRDAHYPLAARAAVEAAVERGDPASPPRKGGPRPGRRIENELQRAAMSELLRRMCTGIPPATVRRIVATLMRETPKTAAAVTTRLTRAPFYLLLRLVGGAQVVDRLKRQVEMERNGIGHRMGRPPAS